MELEDATQKTEIDKSETLKEEIAMDHPEPKAKLLTVDTHESRSFEPRMRAASVQKRVSVRSDVPLANSLFRGLKSANNHEMVQNIDSKSSETQRSSSFFHKSEDFQSKKRFSKSQIFDLIPGTVYDR